MGGNAPEQAVLECFRSGALLYRAASCLCSSCTLQRCDLSCRKVAAACCGKCAVSYNFPTTSTRRFNPQLQYRPWFQGVAPPPPSLPPPPDGSLAFSSRMGFGTTQTRRCSRILHTHALGLILQNKDTARHCYFNGVTITAPFRGPL